MPNLTVGGTNGATIYNATNPAIYIQTNNPGTIGTNFLQQGIATSANYGATGTTVGDTYRLSSANNITQVPATYIHQWNIGGTNAMSLNNITISLPGLTRSSGTNTQLLMMPQNGLSAVTTTDYPYLTNLELYNGGYSTTITLRILGSTQYGNLTISGSTGTPFTGVQAGDILLINKTSGGNVWLNAGASGNVYTSINNTRITTVNSTGLGIGTTAPVGILSVLLDGTGTNNPSVWGTGYALFGNAVASTTGSAVALTYNTSGNYGALICLGPSVSWRDMYYVAQNHYFKNGATSLASIDTSGNITAFGTIFNMTTSNGTTGLQTELASSTTPLLNIQSNFRGTTTTSYLGACFRIDTRNSPLYQWFYRAASSTTENMIMSLNSNGNLYVQSLASSDSGWLTGTSSGGYNTGIQTGIQFTLSGSTSNTATGLYLTAGHSYIIYCSTVGNSFGSNNQWYVYCLVFWYASGTQGYTVANFGQNNINITVQATTGSVLYQTPGGSGSYTAFVSAQRMS
jgi:hypothetical protein